MWANLILRLESTPQGTCFALVHMIQEATPSFLVFSCPISIPHFWRNKEIYPVPLRAHPVINKLRSTIFFLLILLYPQKENKISVIKIKTNALLPIQIFN